jgi:hypothetical protein
VERFSHEVEMPRQTGAKRDAENGIAEPIAPIEKAMVRPFLHVKDPGDMTAGWATVQERPLRFSPPSTG